MNPHQTKIITEFMNNYGPEGINLYDHPDGSASACITSKLAVQIGRNGLAQYMMWDDNRGWIACRAPRGRKLSAHLPHVF